MNETKHTKGPWAANWLWPNARVFRDGAGADLVAEVCGQELVGVEYKQTAQARANARLIAAAPDLLAALCEIRDRYATCIDGLTGESRRVLDIVLTAIRKATGEGE